MATFAEQMVERPPNATCRVWSLATKYRTLLADSAGLKSVTVDGQSVTCGEMEELLPAGKRKKLTATTRDIHRNFSIAGWAGCSTTAAATPRDRP